MRSLNEVFYFIEQAEALDFSIFSVPEKLYELFHTDTEYFSKSL